MASKTDQISRGSFVEVFLVSLKLGLTCFGGPVAHLGYFHQEFVVRRKWLVETEYADLVALCQFLPGPASSQVNMCIGMIRAGWKGAAAAWIGFTIPSALAMIAFAYSMDKLGDLQHAGWLKGLKLAAVAVVAQAVWTMGTKFCRTPLTAIIALMSAAVLLVSWSSLIQVIVIATGALAGWLLLSGGIQNAAMKKQSEIEITYNRKTAVTLLATFLFLFAVLPVLKAITGSPAVASFDAFYRVGSLVFGGGHAVLPLLRNEVVPPGWISDDRFLAGYGAAQALPGPLFTFTAFLGAAMNTEPHGWVGGIWCLFAIFLPSSLLVFGALPFWNNLRRAASARAALDGANTAVVGLLFASFCNPVWSSSVHRPVELLMALAAFILLVGAKLPPWLVVALIAVMGCVFLG